MSGSAGTKASGQSEADTKQKVEAANTKAGSSGSKGFGSTSGSQASLTTAAVSAGTVVISRDALGFHWFGSAYLAAGLAGTGVLRLPGYMARRHLACGDLLPLFQDCQLGPMLLHVAYRPAATSARECARDRVDGAADSATCTGS
ncbi:MAG: hypothetical protein ABW069_01165 [Duganella sp.]